MKTYIEKTLKQNGLQLRFLSKDLQTEENCLWSVENNGWALFYVHNQTPSIIKAALKQNATAAQFIRKENLTKQFKRQVVKPKKTSKMPSAVRPLVS